MEQYYKQFMLVPDIAMWWNLPVICNSFKAEAAVTLRKNKKIANLALIPTLNLTQTLTLALTLMLILTQTQNPTQALTLCSLIFFMGVT